MIKNATVGVINKKLLELHGINDYGDPIFRVVFSDDQLETRKGTFNDFHGKIFIRQVTEIREVKKYPWIKNKWLLERWAPGEIGKHQDYVSLKNGVYVCTYIFQDAHGNYLPPIYKVCEILIKHMLNPPRREELIQRDLKLELEQEKTEFENDLETIKIFSDEESSKDPKAYRESASVGYTKGEDNVK